VIPLKEAYKYKELVGNKAYYLSLVKQKFLTPNGFVVTLEDNDYTIEKALNQYNYRFYSIRSSSFDEDTKEKANAGKYESYIRVPKRKALFYIKKIQEKGIPVLVTKYIKAQYHGVGFVYNKTIIELSKRFATEESDVIYIDGKRIYKNLDLFNKKVDSLLDRIKNKINEIRKYMGFDIDIEFAYNKRLYVLQVRPITKTIPENPNIIVISPGIMEGPVKYIKSEKDKIEGIIYVNRLYYWLSKYLDKIKGIIVKEPTFLSHLAINLRENNIPCVALDFVPKYVRINTYKGIFEYEK